MAFFSNHGGGRRDSNDNGFGAAMILIGVVATIISWLLGPIVAAAVSRQREYLADASAVQFTRNPLGLASALKKIAGFTGARREASEADLESQHLFFASSGGFMEALFSTHPPINERIRRIDPAFDGIVPDVAPAEPAPGEVAGVSRVSVAAVPPPLPAGQPRAVPSDLQIQDSVGFRGAIPAALREASQDPVSAMGLVLGLLLRRDAASRTAQLTKARGLAGGEVGQGPLHRGVVDTGLAVHQGPLPGRPARLDRTHLRRRICAAAPVARAVGDCRRRHAQRPQRRAGGAAGGAPAGAGGACSAATGSASAVAAGPTPTTRIPLPAT